jgi:hypothetical protein
MVRRGRIDVAVCLVGVAACFFAAPLWSRLMGDQSMVDVRAQAEKAPVVFRGRVLRGYKRDCVNGHRIEQDRTRRTDDHKSEAN